MAKVKKEEKQKLPELTTSLNIDTQKVVKEIKKQILEEIDEEISKKIECETINKLDKMEKEYINIKIHL